MVIKHARHPSRGTWMYAVCCKATGREYVYCMTFDEAFDLI